MTPRPDAYLVPALITGAGDAAACRYASFSPSTSAT